MDFKNSIPELIRARTSCRSYRSEPFSPELVNTLAARLSEPHQGPFGNCIEFNLVKQKHNSGSKKIGTYGIIRGARYFIAGLVRPTLEGLLDYGYTMERLILYLTDQGLGSCWLGGTFKRDQFAVQLKPDDKRIIPAVAPLGYPRQHRTLVDRMLRFGAGSRHRKPWSDLFFRDTQLAPLTTTEAGEYAEVLEMVRLGPSASNRQPWRLIKQQHKYHFYLARTKGYQNLTKAVDLQLLDIGIALYHFAGTCQERNLAGQWQKLSPQIPVPTNWQYIISWVANNPD